MGGNAESYVDLRYGRCAMTQPLEFVTAFRSGTGGLRVAVFDDRIVSIGTFESGASQPTHGLKLEVKSPPRDVGYRFDDDATRLAFVRAVRRRMRRDTA
jgi:hypothetical protein